jgi:hypothetical protein
MALNSVQTVASVLADANACLTAQRTGASAQRSTRDRVIAQRVSGKRSGTSADKRALPVVLDKAPRKGRGQKDGDDKGFIHDRLPLLFVERWSNPTGLDRPCVRLVKDKAGSSANPGTDKRVIARSIGDDRSGHSAKKGALAVIGQAA